MPGLNVIQRIQMGMFGDDAPTEPLEDGLLLAENGDNLTFENGDRILLH